MVPLKRTLCAQDSRMELTNVLLSSKGHLLGREGKRKKGERNKEEEKGKRRKE